MGRKRSGINNEIIGYRKGEEKKRERGGGGGRDKLKGKKGNIKIGFSNERKGERKEGEKDGV